MRNKVFISYNRRDSGPVIAKEIQEKLEADGDNVFLDVYTLKGGERWGDKIYDELRMSDVLIVLLDQQTGDSDWVQREVDTARGANISILPIVISEATNVDETMEKLAISDRQRTEYYGNKRNYEAIRESIEQLAKVTKDAQRGWITSLESKWSPVKAENKKSYAAFRLRGSSHPCQIHLSTGDITAHSDIDVIVNTENNYMQMARVFEWRNVSSVLRYRGSLVNKAGHVQEDTVQDELNAQIDEGFGYRPVALGMVLPTHAGHPKSDLARKTKARYIFHAASVTVTPGQLNNPLQPIETDSGISECVMNCLNQLLDVNENKGVISPEGTARYEEEVAESERFEPIHSIILPLLGTGRGGRAVNVVIPPILEAIDHFLRQTDKTQTLTDIYIAIYADRDIPLAEGLMEAKFERI